MLLFRNSMPQLDLHGMDREIARLAVLEFLRDQQKMGYYDVAIIHGIGQGILKQTVFEVLKREKCVKCFGLDLFNGGCTLVELKRE